MEEWKDVVGWEEFYEVSTLGNVRSKRKKIILKPSNVLGYRQVMLCKDGKRITGRINRLVAKAFIPNPENKPQVNHKNGVRNCDLVENLEWVTESENVQHSYDKLNRLPTHGQTHNKAKLTNDQVREIRGKYIPYKYSYAKIGKEYGVDQSAIFLIIKGKNWKYLV
jgi:hypothetical protein